MFETFTIFIIHRLGSLYMEILGYIMDILANILPFDVFGRRGAHNNPENSAEIQRVTKSNLCRYILDQQVRIIKDDLLGTLDTQRGQVFNKGTTGVFPQQPCGRSL